jgi:glutamyl-queuosine tRNA(Asp) synthetase
MPSSTQRNVVGRFAPTPSGRLHLGNLYSFLVAWLVARSHGGRVILRIEDLDFERLRPGLDRLLMDDLEWLGLTWDEGPFYQHDRLDLYESAFHMLEGKGLVYPCFCSRADWHAASAPHAGDHFVYPGTCRNLTPEQRKERALHKDPAYRIRLGEGTFRFHDMFQGGQSYDLQRDCGDVIVRRADGVFAYQLAVVVDDADMGVTEVVRGADLLDSVPVQWTIADALGLGHPTYGHLPVIMTRRGKRLAKRDASEGMDRLRERFPTPEALIGHIANVTGLIRPDVRCEFTDRQGRLAISAEQLLQVWDLESLRRPSLLLPEDEGV